MLYLYMDISLMVLWADILSILINQCGNTIYLPNCQFNIEPLIYLKKIYSNQNFPFVFICQLG